LTWRNRSQREVHAVFLHLYLNAFEGNYSTFYSEKRNKGFDFRTGVSDEDGEWGHIQLAKVLQAGAPVPWYFVHPDGGPETDHTVVRFDLPTAVPPGGSTPLDIDPLHLHYLDTNKLDDSRTIKADRSASNRWASEIAALIELFLSTVATI